MKTLRRGVLGAQLVFLALLVLELLLLTTVEQNNFLLQHGGRNKARDVSRGGVNCFINLIIN